jgi:hypothetical protein
MSLKQCFKILCASVIFAGANAFAKKDQLQEYFENVSAEVREEVIKQLSVADAEYMNKNVRVDVLDELNANCKGFVTYVRNAEGNIVKPTVDCNYVADDGLDGMSPKFKCKFTNVLGETKKLKVKYGYNVIQSGKEIATGIVGPSMARLMGFKADTYCPAIVNCKGCSADPWSKDENNQYHSSKPAIAKSTTTFNYALVEIKLEGWKVSEPRNGAKKPLGFDWEELKSVDDTLSESLKDQRRIEREAYMLWINFIYHTDADAHNNRLICEKLAEEDSSVQVPKCGVAAGYVHDYGDAFKRMNLTEFTNTLVFFNGFTKLHPFASWGTAGNKCVGTMSGGEGAISNAEFSEEARNVLLERAQQITKEQLLDLFSLAEVNAIDSTSTPEAWANLIIDKFANMSASKSKKACAVYSSGDSVLHP